MKKQILYFYILVVFFPFLNLPASTRTIGSGGNFSTLKEAFDSINAGIITGEIELQLTGNTTETATATLNATGSGSASYSSIVLYPTTSGLSISGSIAGALISLDGTSNFIIDGRVNYSGATVSLTIENSSTSTSASTIKFTNSANANTIKYCYVKGSSTSATSGIIVFSTSTSGSGNDNNKISYCNITNSGGNKSTNVIYSIGSSGAENSGNTIENNNIYDHLRTNATSYGINLYSNTSQWNISNNSFYQTSTLTMSGGLGNKNINFIYINSGDGYTIANNYIGGSGPLCNGTFVKDAQNSILNALYLNVGITNTTSIQGNQISNFDFTNTGSGSFYAIYLNSGKINIGNLSANTIGSLNDSTNIYFKNAQNTGAFYGIYIPSSDDINCYNNIISGIKTDNSNTAYSTSFYGLYKTSGSGSINIVNNTIGDATFSNSIIANSISTGSTQDIKGIYSDGTGNVVITNNTISNLVNRTNGSNGTVTGIICSSSATISYNAIKELYSYTGRQTTTYDAPIVGISVYGSGMNYTLNNNEIHSIYDRKENSDATLIGIFDGASGTTNASSNFIYSLGFENTSNIESAYIFGAYLESGTKNYVNNIIYINNSDEVLRFIGLNDNGTLSSLFFNTIYIAGTCSSNNTIASASIYNGTDNSIDYRNNIFVNLRHSTGTNAKDYATYLSAGTFNGLNYNDYWVNTSYSNSIYGGYLEDDYMDISYFYDGNGDNYSLTVDPSFTGSDFTQATSFKVGASLPGTYLSSYTTDYGGNTRHSTSVTMGAWESTINRWTGAVSSDWNTAGNWSLNSILTEGATLIFSSAASRDCYLDQNHTVQDIENPTTQNLNLNGHTLTITGVIDQTNNYKIIANGTSSNIKFSGSEAQTLYSNDFSSSTVNDITINNPLNVKINGTLNINGTITSTSGYLDAYSLNPAIIFSGSSAQTISSGNFLNDKAYNATIANSSGVTLNSNFTVSNTLTINSGDKLTVSPSCLLQVDGSITNNAGTSGLLLKSSSSSPNASLIFSGTAPQASVEYYSKASISDAYYWQFIGIPVQSISYSSLFSAPYTYVRLYNESGNGSGTTSGTSSSNRWILLNSSSTLNMINGYEITQSSPKTYTYTGALYNGDISQNLTYTETGDYPGQNLISNPYTAAIDISQINFGVNANQTIYMYNAGSYAQWLATESSQIGNNPGQYIAVAKNLAGSAGLPAEIPSMQAFLVLTSATSTISIPYSAAITQNTKLQRSKKAEKDYLKITLKSDHGGDVMWLFEIPETTQGFDNGWDAYKMSTNKSEIYSVTEGGEFQISSVPDIDSTEIYFKAGSDSIYTLVFDNNLNNYSNLYLYDKVLDNFISIKNAGTIYEFVAKNTTALNRFRITSNTSVVTDNKDVNPDISIKSDGERIFINNATNDSGHITIYTTNGQEILNKFLDAKENINFIPGLKSGCYIIKIRTAKKDYNKSIILF
ncbi:MAG: T9SS type A sorting domain-containing protein [Paludibacter sp.]|nr:T9SS type A sorting domain-containing protein [Paludibacter sp.]